MMVKGWFVKLHEHCRDGALCRGPGCVRRTGKTERKRGRRSR